MKNTTRRSVAVHCKCGYVFVISKPPRSRSFESYAVIRDKQYQQFLKSEAKLLASIDESAKFRALAKSSALVGSLYECPDCARLVFALPGGEAKASYRREDE